MISRMNARTRNVALLLAVVPALAGCKLLGLGNGFAQNTSLQQRLPEGFGEQQLAEGRQALRDGNTISAIESFQLAKLYPEHAAAAANGLAVAYSRLGRTDLTERYFQVAIALAPENDRYRANIARFYASNPVPPEVDPGAALAALQATEPLSTGEPINVALTETTVPPPARAGGVSVEQAGSRVRRVSRNEVMISDAPTPARIVNSARQRQAVIEVGARSVRTPAVRVGTLSGAQATRPAYPVRIELAPR